MPAPTTPTMQATSMSQLDLHNATSINESRNNFVDQRPFRIAQENPLPRYSPSNYQPTGYGPQNPPMSSYNMTPLPGQNSERCSPTRSSGRVRNRVSPVNSMLVSSYLIQYSKLNPEKIALKCR